MLFRSDREHRPDDRHHRARGLVDEVRRGERQGDAEEHATLYKGARAPAALGLDSSALVLQLAFGGLTTGAIYALVAPRPLLIADAVNSVGPIAADFDEDGAADLLGKPLPLAEAMGFSAAAFRAYFFTPDDNHAYHEDFPGAEWLEDTLELENYGAYEALSAHTASDIRNPIVQKGIPTVGLGPLCGDLTQNGRHDEWVDLDDYLRAIKVAARTIADWCGTA